MKSGANKIDQELIKKMSAGEYDENETKFTPSQIAKMLDLSEECVKNFLPKQKKAKKD